MVWSYSGASESNIICSNGDNYPLNGGFKMKNTISGLCELYEHLNGSIRVIRDFNHFGNIQISRF